MNTKSFIDTYYITRKNKRRSADSVEFELHWERDLFRLMRGLDEHTFSPSAYTFIAPRPQPREVFACEMPLRICHHYIDERERPLIENELTSRTFNNRIGFGGVEAINTLVSDIYEVSKGFTQDAWIIKMDLSGYFPNARQDIVFRQLSDLIDQKYDGDDKDLLQYMILRSVYSNPTEHCYRKSPLHKWAAIPKEKSLFSKPPGIGGAIGHLIWQNAMNYYLNDIDHWIVDVGLPIHNVSYPFSEMAPEVLDKFLTGCGLHYLRFVDDIVIVTDNKEACLSYVIPELRKRLADLGCTLHPKKFYCQHYTKGVNFIGTTVKIDRVYASLRNVRNFTRAVRQYNKCPRPSKLEIFLSSMNSYLGILKTRNGYAIIRDVLEEINPKWFTMCNFNEDRKCLQAEPGYTHRELLARKYHIKLKTKKKNDNKRKNLRSGVAPARTPGNNG